jgi:hypothetical protein
LTAGLSQAVMSGSSTEVRASALKVMGNTLFVNKEYHEAIAKYTDAIDIAPNAILYAKSGSVLPQPRMLSEICGIL